MSDSQRPEAHPSEKPRPSKARRVASGCAISIVLIAALLFGLLKLFDKALPAGEPGPAADAFARGMADAVDVDAWSRTGAVTWDFSGRQQHLWDRRRGFARVTWKQYEVLLDLQSRRGVARHDGQELDATETAPLLEKAWAFWCNDSFWLNPVAKLFDDGVVRSLAEVDGNPGLLVTYGSGGVTPGDSYLWAADGDGLPETWWMWTQILPVGGVKASWDGWITLDTGARVATEHKIGVLTLALSDVRGASSLGELVGDTDPFAPLVELLDSEL